MVIINYFAAVGDDGTGALVWGLGGTEAEALEDALDQEGLSAEELAGLVVYQISEAQCEEIELGAVEWPPGRYDGTDALEDAKQ